MKRSVLIIIAWAISFVSVAQEVAPTSTPKKDFYAPFHRLGAGISIGSMDGFGFDVEVATSLSKWCSWRVGMTVAPGITYNKKVNLKNEIDKINAELKDMGHRTIEESSVNAFLKGTINRVQLHVLFDFYPLPDRIALFLTAGFYYGGKKNIQVEGNIADWPEILAKAKGVRINGRSVDDFREVIDNNGDVHCGVLFNAFRPYIGIGYGYAIPKKRLGFRVEVGMQLKGSYEIVDAQGGPLNPKIKDKIYEKAEGMIDYVKAFPMIKVSLRGRII